MNMYTVIRIILLYNYTVSKIKKILHDFVFAKVNVISNVSIYFATHFYN